MSFLSNLNLEFASLYSGAGGFDLGFAQAGFHGTFANDIDKHAVATHLNLKHIPDSKWARASRNMKNCTSLAGDVNKINELIPSSLDLIIGGPPCQGFSVSGKMDPNDPRSEHIFKFINIINEKRPTAFVMENVSSLATNPRWENTLDKLLHDASQNYEVLLTVLNAADWGVPQNRKRMFLIGFPKGMKIKLENFSNPQKKLTTVRDALHSLARTEGQHIDWHCNAKITLAKNPVLRQSAYAGLMLNGSGRVIDLDQPSPTLPASMGGNRTPIIDLDQLEQKKKPWIESYHRDLLLNKNKKLNSIPKNVRMRRISAREAASIQTFPNGISWQGTKSSIFRQIGNAVPPVLSHELAKIIKENIFEEKND